MCYSSETSLSFGIIGICSYLYIELYEPKLNKTGIQYLLLFYSFMEFLQSFQYSIQKNYFNPIFQTTNSEKVAFGSPSKIAISFPNQL
jgi:hypothetical protein